MSRTLQTGDRGLVLQPPFHLAPLARAHHPAVTPMLHCPNDFCMLSPILQTETPEQLAKRNADLKGTGQKQAGVVRREKVAVLSRGTLIDAEMVQSRPDASYIMAGGWVRRGAGKGCWQMEVGGV